MQPKRQKYGELRTKLLIFGWKYSNQIIQIMFVNRGTLLEYFWLRLKIRTYGSEKRDTINHVRINFSKEWNCGIFIHLYRLICIGYFIQLYCVLVYCFCCIQKQKISNSKIQNSLPVWLHHSAEIIITYKSIN